MLSVKFLSIDGTILFSGTVEELSELPENQIGDVEEAFQVVFYTDGIEINRFIRYRG